MNVNCCWVRNDARPTPPGTHVLKSQVRRTLLHPSEVHECWGTEVNNAVCQTKPYTLADQSPFVEASSTEKDMLQVCLATGTPRPPRCTILFYSSAWSGKPFASSAIVVGRPGRSASCRIIWLCKLLRHSKSRWSNPWHRSPCVSSVLEHRCTMRSRALRA